AGARAARRLDLAPAPAWRHRMTSSASPHFYLLPADGAASATRLDSLALALLLLTGAVVLVVLVLTIGFAVRYRAGSDADRSNAPSQGRGIEIAWTLTPLLLFLGIYAWAAIDYVTGLGREAILAHEERLRDYAHERLGAMNSLRILGRAPGKGAILSFEMRGAHAHDVATVIDRAGIAVRAGTHCAQP
ncbi:aminotransferase class V-fold PLP-dependent enzyme, partial [Bradyrhizobium sp. IC4060]|nr:aminotransferase class V-fold PLP-dependent enzyme [Bradyrhizobium sp. IC4060]